MKLQMRVYAVMFSAAIALSRRVGKELFKCAKGQGFFYQLGFFSSGVFSQVEVLAAHPCTSSQQFAVAGVPY